MELLIVTANVCMIILIPSSFLFERVYLCVGHIHVKMWCLFQLLSFLSNRAIKPSFDFLGPEPMDISTTSTSQTREIPSSDVTILEGHTSEVKYIINA